MGQPLGNELHITYHALSHTCTYSQIGSLAEAQQDPSQYTHAGMVSPWLGVESKVLGGSSDEWFSGISHKISNISSHQSRSAESIWCAKNSFLTRQRKHQLFHGVLRILTVWFPLSMHETTKKPALLLLCFTFFRTPANTGSCSKLQFSQCIRRHFQELLLSLVVLFLLTALVFL